jgi:predicted nucleotidyltransferase
MLKNNKTIYYILFIILVLIILFIIYEYIIYHIVSNKIYFHTNFYKIYLEKYNNTHLHKNKLKNNLTLRIINDLQHILNIEKIYFTGSIIRNDFIENKSDIDILYFTYNNNINNDLLLIKNYLFELKNKYNLNNFILIKEKIERKYCNIFIDGDIFTIKHNNMKIQLCSYNIKYKYIMLNYYFSSNYSITQFQINIIYFIKLLKNKIISNDYYKELKKYIFQIGFYEYYFKIYDKKILEI